MSAIVRVVRVALPLAAAIAGLVVGYLTRDHEAAEEAMLRPNQSALDEAALQKRMFAHGSALLKERKDTAQISDLRTYLGQTYLGLYYIGRAGGKLKADYAESLARELQHLHTQHRPRKDQALANWYQTLGVSNQHTLSELLDSCPEVKKLGVDPRYIASAFGEKTDGLIFDGLLEELMHSIKI